MLRGGKNFKLSQAIRGKQVTLLILFVCVVAGSGILAYVWSQTDAQIDRGSKIGITVAFSSIIVANLIGLIVTGSSRLFSLETTSSGYRYPAGIRYLLYGLSITLGTLCIVIVSSNQIADKTTQTALSVTTGLFAVLSGLLGLYFHSTLLPIDFDALTEYSKKQKYDIFNKELFLDEDFAEALQETMIPSELQDILIQTHNSGDYSTFLQTLKDVNLSDILDFREKLLSRAFEKANPLPAFEKATDMDVFGLGEQALQTAKVKLGSARQTLGKLFEKKPKEITEQDKVLDYVKSFFKKQGTQAFERIGDLEKQLSAKGFTARPYYKNIRSQFEKLAKQATIDSLKEIVKAQVESGKAPTEIMGLLVKFPSFP